MSTHKENCEYHVIEKFEERFTEKDFTKTWYHKGKSRGEVVWKEEVVNAIVNAPQMGTLVKGGKGDCVIYRIKVMNTKTVFVVWNKFLDCAVTVITGAMWSNSTEGTGGELDLGRFCKWNQ